MRPAKNSGAMTDTGLLVLDASAMVDLLLDSDAAAGVRDVIANRPLAAPAHFDVEVLSALGRLQRAGDLTESDVSVRIERLVSAPIQREPLVSLLAGAWARRGDTRLADALYIELAVELDTVVVTADRRLARAHPSRVRLPPEFG